MSIQIDIVRQVVNVQILEDRVVQVALWDGISVYENGDFVGSTRTIEFNDGSNTTVSVQKIGSKIVVSIDSSGGSPSGDFWKVAGTTTLTGAATITGSVPIEILSTNSELEISPNYAGLFAPTIALEGMVRIINDIVVITDASSISLSGAEHTLTTSQATITVTDNYTGDYTGLRLTLSGITQVVLTFSTGTALCVFNGTASGNNTMTITGISGDVIEIIRKKSGSNYTYFGQNVKRVSTQSSRRILYKNHVASSAGSTTSETIVDSFLVAGGTMGANDALDIDLMFSKTNQNGTWSMAVYVNTSSSLVGATLLGSFSAGATTRFNRLFRTMWFRNSVSSQSMFNTAATSSNDDYSISTAEPTALSIDFSTDKYFIIAVDPNSLSDTCYIQCSLFEIIRS